MTKPLIFITGFIMLSIIIFASWNTFETLVHIDDKNNELAFMGSSGWQWHNKSQGLQIKRVDGYLPALRKVSDSKEYASLITITESGNYRGFVFFDQDCEEGAIVSEHVAYGEAEPTKREVLHCLHGKLVYMKNWATAPTERWQARVGDFEFDEALNEWDFTPLQQAYLKSVAELI
ncbi:hypothetical protein D1814_05550 [Alteromonas sp. BL110]|uniref:hypothetical protein n=1 Tax=Alteromonas sp. BL110 TaxID=1714845 RepID=UPI000E4B2C64|nr:hypothetical protein [Alteromonas sp. BL110]AXT38175.1 hypothetical protein D1814_05550 [Alteromonas sp. BL110]RKM80919.1 hypothetical protein D7031_18895 [Alteromonas sp. BL110]